MIAALRLLLITLFIALPATAQAKTDAGALARADIQRGRVEEAAGAHARAESHFRHAIRRLTPIHGADHPLIAEVYSDLAHALDGQGREEEAEPLHRRALTIILASEGERNAKAALYLGGIASNLDRQGDHAEAEQFYRKALAIDTALFGAASEASSIAACHLGSNLIMQGRAREAVPLFEAALATLGARATAGPEARLDILWCRQGLALALDRAGRQAEAEPLHRQALREGLEQFGARSPHLASLYRHLAENLIDQGRTDEAQPFFREDLRITRRAAQARSAPLAASLATLAIHMARQKRGRTQALGLAREAAAIARSRHARDHGPAGFGRRAANDERARVRALTGFGRTQPDWRHEAFESLLIAAWLHAGDAPRERDALRDEAFRAAQELGATASGLAIVAAETRHAMAGGPLGELVREQQSLSAELRELDRQALHALAADQAEKADELRSRSEEAATALARIEAKLHARFPAYAELVQPRSVGIAEAQKRLGPNEALLLIVPAGEDMFSFTVSPKGASWHRSEGTRRSVGARVARLRCQVDPITCDTPDDESDLASPYEQAGYASFDGAAAHSLYQDLIAPLAATATRASRLYVTASGSLADLPLGLLLTAPPVAGADQADPAVLLASRWLADAHAIVRLPTISAFRTVKLVERRDESSVPFIGYGAPRLADLAPAGLGSRGGVLLAVSRGQMMARGLAVDELTLLRTLPSLPGTERELHAMSGVLEATTDALHLGDAATEASIRANAVLGRARVVTFATHGLLPNDLPGLKEPGLVFTPPDTPTADDDGILTASEASQLQLNADWVILSACNTASPVGTPGAASISSLARAFLYAGSRALLASHWRVSDDATAALTVETLAARRRQPGITRAEAFQQAQRAVRTGLRGDGTRIAQWDDSWAHPSAWAPLSLISDRDE